MDLLERLLGHDAWTTHQLLLRCQDLTDEQLDRDFDIGHRTVRATLLHIIRNIEIWSDLMTGKQVRKGQETNGCSIPVLTLRLNLATKDFGHVARNIAQRRGWDEKWVDHLDNPPTEKSYGGAIVHVITHNMHHRAQLLYLLRLVGVENLPEGDVFSWEQQVHNEAET